MKMILNSLFSLRWAVLLGMAGMVLPAQSPIGTIISEQSRTSFTMQGAGARAMGLGGAFIAVADDATAVSFNPAGLAQLLKPEVSFVARGAKREVAYEDVATTAGAKRLLVSDSLISNTQLDPLFFAATVPLRLGDRTLSLQLSLQKLISLSESDTRDLTELPQDITAASVPSRLTQSINQSGQIDVYSFAMAYEASQRILLGFSVNVWRGTWDLDSRSSKTSGTSKSYVNFSQSNHLDGSNFNLGLIWRWPTWSLGLVHRTAFHATYSFGTVLDTSALAKPSVNKSIETGLHWPSTTGIGLAYRPWERWLFASDITRTAWSTARHSSSRPSLDGLNFFDLDKGTRTPDSTDFHIGVERILLTTSGSVIPLRLGYSREPQPVVDRVTGEQRVINGLTLGSGLKRGAYTVDLAYRFGWGTRRTSQFLDVDQILSKTPPTSLGTERLREHRVDVSFNIQFERQPVERLLRHLFVGD